MKKFFSSFFLLGVVGFLSVEAQSYEQWINKSIDHLERNRLDSAEYALKKPCRWTRQTRIMPCCS